MGSVKDLHILKQPSEKEHGVGHFRFSDRYSVFDWGEMPDHIPNKGAALCLMSAYCFEQAEQKGMRTHYRGLVGKGGKIVRTDDLLVPADTMEVDLVRVIRPAFTDGQYRYDVFVSSFTNFLIPLEVIYRNSLPHGSSFIKRLAKGEVCYEDYGLDHHPEEGEKFASPIFDYSTKLEARDRYVSRSEAQRISGLSSSECKEIEQVLFTINTLISKIANSAGLQNEDGKIELAFDNQRKLLLVDVIGTLDECRFTYNGLHVSKEVTRQYYKETQWYHDVEDAKQKAEIARALEWKSFCASQPPRLDPIFVEIVSQLYTASANAFLKRAIFDAPLLPEVLNRYTLWMSQQIQRNRNQI